MWLSECRHRRQERWCNDCYDDARASSETASGTWRPAKRRYGKNYRVYLRGDIPEVDPLLKTLEDEFGHSPRVRVKLK